MRVAVVGGNGQLGSDVAQAFTEAGDTVCALTHEDVEINVIDSATTALTRVAPNVIVNTAALHQVERCEQDPKAAFDINALGARNLAMVARGLGAVMIQVSTDYVFDGLKNTPYEEGDTPLPLNVYGITKLAGEHFVSSTLDRHFIVRTSALYGQNPCRGKGGLNFVDLMLKLGTERGRVRVVSNEQVTPTSTRDLARQIVTLSRTDAFGVFHATAEGSCTWYDFAREIFAGAGLSVNVEIADPQEFPSKTPRPKYSVLENASLKAHRLNCFGPWQEGLRRYLSLAPLVSRGV